jgi:hypothetical protein
MLLPCQASLPTAAPPCPTLPHRKRRAVDILEVVFSTTGDLIRVHSYDTGCSATWNTALTYGRLTDERGNGTAVAIRSDEWAWLNGIRTLAAAWLVAAESDDRSWMAQEATRIQRYDDRSNGLIDLVVAWQPE